MSKWVRVANGVVQEIIPDAATTPSVAYWFGAVFASQCIIAPDNVQQGWIYDVLSETFSERVQQEPTEPPTDDITILQVAVAKLAEAQAADQTANELALAELADVIAGGGVS